MSEEINVKGEKRTVEGFFRLENRDDGLSHTVFDFGQTNVADNLKNGQERR